MAGKALHHHGIISEEYSNTLNLDLLRSRREAAILRESGLQLSDAFRTFPVADPILGVQVGDKRVIPLFNFERPRPVTRTFTTLRDNQPKALFQFLLKEADGSGWFLAGKIVLDGIPAAPAGRPTFELSLIPRSSGEVLIELADRARGAKKRFLLSSSVLQKRRVPVSRMDPGTLALKGEAAQPKERRKWMPPLPSMKRVFRGPGLVLVVVLSATVVVAVVLFFALPRLGGIAASVASPRSEITPASTERPSSTEKTTPATAPESTPGGAREPAADGGGTTGDMVAGDGVSGDGAAADSAIADTVSGASSTGTPGSLKEELQQDGAPLEESPQEGDHLQVEQPEAVPDREDQPGRLEQDQPQQGRQESGVEEDNAGETSYHHIQWGDTLWRITERYYGNPELYPLLAVENEITDPNLIIPGRDIRLPQKIDERERKDAR